MELELQPAREKDSEGDDQETSSLYSPSSSTVGSTEIIFDLWADEVARAVVNVSLDFDEPSKIFPDLFLGGRDSATNATELRRLGVTHILNLGGLHLHFPDHGPPFAHMDLEADDRSDFPLMDLFYTECRNFVQTARAEKGKVLIHCRGGVNRSATIVVALCMDLEGWDLLTAVRYVFKRRPIILANRGFQRQLVHFAWSKNQLVPKRDSQSS